VGAGQSKAAKKAAKKAAGRSTEPVPDAPAGAADPDPEF